MDKIVRAFGAGLLMIVAACGSSQPSSAPASIPTSNWSSGDAGMASLIEGNLTADSNGCLVIDDVVLLWPKGYTARTSSQGTVEVLNQDGKVVARTGAKFSAGGGRSMVGASGSCVEGRNPNSVFQINADLPPIG